MGIPATGKQISFGGINLFRSENGKVVEDWVYRDTVGMMRQLGALPALSQPKKKNRNVDLESITCSSHCEPYQPESIFRDGP